MIDNNMIRWLVIAFLSFCGITASYGIELDDDTLEVFTAFESRVKRTYALRYDGEKEAVRKLVTQKGFKFVGRVRSYLLLYLSIEIFRLPLDQEHCENIFEMW